MVNRQIIAIDFVKPYIKELFQAAVGRHGITRIETSGTNKTGFWFDVYAGGNQPVMSIDREDVSSVLYVGGEAFLLPPKNAANEDKPSINTCDGPKQYTGILRGKTTERTPPLQVLNSVLGELFNVSISEK